MWTSANGSASHPTNALLNSTLCWIEKGMGVLSHSITTPTFPHKVLIGALMYFLFNQISTRISLGLVCCTVFVLFLCWSLPWLVTIFPFLSFSFSLLFVGSPVLAPTIKLSGYRIKHGQLAFPHKGSVLVNDQLLLEYYWQWGDVHGSEVTCLPAK